jgi:hypothetical protein
MVTGEHPPRYDGIGHDDAAIMSQRAAPAREPS